MKENLTEAWMFKFKLEIRNGKVKGRLESFSIRGPIKAKIEKQN